MRLSHKLYFLALAIIALSCSSVEITEAEWKYVDSAKIVAAKYYKYTDAGQIDSAKTLFSDYFKNKKGGGDFDEGLRYMCESRGKSSERILQGFGIKKIPDGKNYVWLAYQVEYDSTQVTALDTFWYFFQDHFVSKIDSVHFISLK